MDYEGHPATGPTPDAIEPRGQRILKIAAGRIEHMLGLPCVATTRTHNEKKSNIYIYIYIYIYILYVYIYICFLLRPKKRAFEIPHQQLFDRNDRPETAPGLPAFPPLGGPAARVQDAQKWVATGPAALKCS